MKLKLVFTAFLLIGTQAIFSQQKYGHINTGNILESLPAITLADSILASYQSELQQKENQLIAAFEKEYMEFVKKANAGEVPKVTIEKKQAEFQKKEQEIIDLQKEHQQKISQKRRELLDPILKNLQDIVHKIAKEKGYSYIFDIGSGAFLYAQDTEDIEPLVRAELGIK